MPLGNTSRRNWLTGLLSILGLSQVAGAGNVVERLATKIPDSGRQRISVFEYDAQGRLISELVKVSPELLTECTVVFCYT
jgi:YD repeat-containing protein